MVLQGIVLRVSEADNCGVILGPKSRQYYFHINECENEVLPELHSEVSFVKDPDFKSTLVAHLVKPVRKSAKVRPFNNSKITELDNELEQLEKLFG